VDFAWLSSSFALIIRNLVYWQAIVAAIGIAWYVFKMDGFVQEAEIAEQEWCLINDNGTDVDSPKSNMIQSFL
jgi:hypothetical protein